MRAFAPIFALWIAFPSKAAEAVIPFNPADYPRVSLAMVEKTEACKTDIAKGGVEVKDLLLSTELMYQGAVRPVSGPRAKLMRSWTKHVGDAQAIAQYDEEVSIIEGKRVYWMPASKELILLLNFGMEHGDQALFYLVLAGCASGEQVFVIDEFHPKARNEEEEKDLKT